MGEMQFLGQGTAVRHMQMRLEGSGFLQAWNHPSPHWLLTLGRWLMLSEHRDMRFFKKMYLTVLRP